MQRLGFMGIDQYGEHYKMDKHPRKELLARLGRKHASKMYIDTKSGESRHEGYIIAGLWISVYQVCAWK